MEMENIVLIGFMGSGKSTVGQELAARLDLEFVDSDQLLVEKAGQQITEIFAQHGEAHFRSLEKEVVAELAQQEGLVIATGGGVVLDSDNIERLQKQGTLVLLQAEPEVILDRVKDSDRPLLDVADPLAEIKKLLSTRESYYQAAADYVIDTSQLEVEEVVEKIVATVLDK
ncbi:shikimate kinase [Fuchsiella alkaliacetigena]|uniref:shikimate kinase n=1 Tax=Fuchsiella alkaliacetigena TaxID=957042 RepID=UPI00200B11E0|nr:shikimate kinase [Fuchsiella alkaliacetigena]MCK8825293.1 shikimate kinase [Fuchsiella alkaliacetigena]